MIRAKPTEQLGTDLVHLQRTPCVLSLTASTGFFSRVAEISCSDNGILSSSIVIQGCLAKNCDTPRSRSRSSLGEVLFLAKVPTRFRTRHPFHNAHQTIGGQAAVSTDEGGLLISPYINNSPHEAPLTSTHETIHTTGRLQLCIHPRRGGVHLRDFKICRPSSSSAS